VTLSTGGRTPITSTAPAGSPPLPGFAQGGGDKRRIGIIYRAAGKGDLAGVLAQQRRTLGQQQAGLRPAHDRHQHRRLPLIERMARRLRAQQLKAGQKIIQIEGAVRHGLVLQLVQDTINFIKSFLIFRLPRYPPQFRRRRSSTVAPARPSGCEW
jgi:hypothetical protein